MSGLVGGLQKQRAALRGPPHCTRIQDMLLMAAVAVCSYISAGAAVST